MRKLERRFPQQTAAWLIGTHVPCPRKTDLEEETNLTLIRLASAHLERWRSLSARRTVKLSWVSLIATLHDSLPHFNFRLDDIGVLKS